MPVALHAMAVGSFAPMLKSLAEILDKAAAHPDSATLPDARLAPDMFTLAQQIGEACFYARDAISRLSAQHGAEREDPGKTLAELKAYILETVSVVRGAPAHAFEGDEDADCSLEISDGQVIEMNGTRFIKSWALPHFYFHLVTAYAILRHAGVEIGKFDYLSQVSGFIRPKG